MARKRVKAAPEGFGTLTPYLCVKGAAAAIEFYKKAFGAEELARVPGPDGRVAHAELRVGGSRFLLSDEFGELGVLAPRSYGGTPVTMVIFVEDCDATVRRAEAAGGRLKKPVTDEFYGDRVGIIEDPYGHVWHVSTHQRDIPLEELKRLSDEHFRRGAAG